MDKDNRKNDGLTDLSDFNRKYNHYLDSDNEPVEESAVKPEIHDDFEDISSYSDGNADFYMSPREEVKTPTKKKAEHSEPKAKNKNFFTRDSYRNSKIIALVLVIAILLTIGGFLVYIVASTSGGDWGDEGIDFNQGNDDSYLADDNHDWQAMGDVNADSLNDFLYSWANNNGEKMYSKNVINVLLCGVDSETGDASSGRSDIMMLVSINKKTKKITMTSFLRDSWTYMRVPKENGTSYDYYFKMNAAYNLGGPATLLQTIENNYKIVIDEYIAVDFNSFPKLIDALGGVEVEVQEYEAKYIRRTSKQKDFPIGKTKLNGTQALIYSRIRKCDADSDISRTRRQRSVIKGLIDSAKSATKGQLLNAFKQVSEYLRTGYTQSEVFGLVAQAVAYNWMDFEMVELVLPNEDFVDRASTYVNGQSTWVVDYALCAQKLQMALYGETNIVLSNDRKSVLDLVTNRRETTTKNSYSNSGSSDGGSSNYVPTSTTTAYDDEPSSGIDTDEATSSTEPSSRPSFTLPTINIPGIGDDDTTQENTESSEDE